MNVARSVKVWRPVAVGLAVLVVATSAHWASSAKDAVTAAASVPQSAGSYPSRQGIVRQVAWGSCDATRNDIDPDVQCGTMRLPVDWSRPAGESYVARVYRQPAQGVRRGTAIYFPSGPGENADVGFSWLAAAAPGYDRIGIDPRGVSTTSLVTCDASAVIAAPLATPSDPQAFYAGQAQRARIGRSCRSNPPSLRRHLDAYSDARDAEALRLAVGSPRLVVTGHSFGTLLAARYLELFGNQARGAILDGVLNPGEQLISFQRTAAAASQRLFDEFAAWCRRSATCSVRSPGASQAFARAKRNADAGLIAGHDLMGRVWTAGSVVQAFELTASTGDFAATATVIEALARAENPSLDHTESIPPGTFIPFPDYIVCADFDLGIRDVVTAAGVAAVTRHHDIPFNTNSSAYTVGCSGAPLPSPGADNPFRAQGRFPVLLLSNRIDIATPREWAATVAGRLGVRARQFVTTDIGHGTSGNKQAQRATNDYINNLN